jgi:protein-S-isoprenylcysteine O-methyltransferase Ste14
VLVGRGRAMKELLLGSPVGWPSIAAFSAGALLFLLAVLRIRFFKGGAASRENARSGMSVVGVALQMLGFATTGFGAIRVSLPPASLGSVLQTSMVAALMACAVSLFAAAANELGRNWSIVARTREDHQLVTSGAFAYVRNPIYTAMAFFLLGLAVGFGHERNLLWGAPLFIVGTWIRVQQEERLLHASFGPAYDGYANRVKRFIPGLL